MAALPSPLCVSDIDVDVDVDTVHIQSSCMHSHATLRINLQGADAAVQEREHEGGVGGMECVIQPIENLGGEMRDVYICRYIHMYIENLGGEMQDVYIYMYICMYIYMYIYQ